MTISFLHRSISLLLVMQLAVPLGYAGQQTPVNQQPQNSTSAPAQSPGDTPALESRPEPGADQNTKQPESPNKPVGTATAPYEKPSGVAASRPAGAVIAPAKQRHIHTIFIRVAIVAAAAAAVGAVAALSQASPGQPR
jgi:hypothetical protein